MIDALIVCLITFLSIFYYFFLFCLNSENSSKMPAKPRTIPPALNLSPEVNLLTEFALIATSPQSPLVREVSGDNSDARRREDDSPPPQLMVCRWGTGEREVYFLPRSLENTSTGRLLCVKCTSYKVLLRMVCNLVFLYEAAIDL